MTYRANTIPDVLKQIDLRKHNIIISLLLLENWFDIDSVPYRAICVKGLFFKISQATVFNTFRNLMLLHIRRCTSCLKTCCIRALPLERILSLSKYAPDLNLISFMSSTSMRLSIHHVLCVQRLAFPFTAILFV